MKYAFIINPASGHGKHEDKLMASICELIESSSKDIKIYHTEGRKDAMVLADVIATEAGDEQVVIFACGGDGTLHEVVNGLAKHDNAILGVVPVGSGNDFVKTLGGGKYDRESFLDLDRQVNGDIVKMDLIKMTYIKDGEETSSYVVNSVNIGFDGNVAMLQGELKKSPLVPNSLSYMAAIGILFAGKKGGNVRLTVDGKELHAGQMLLATVGNGAFCGGGFESCPYADIYDGLAEVLVINDIKRRQFLRLVSKYKNGEIFEVPNIEELTKYSQAKLITIEPMGAPTMSYVVDGETYETGAIRLEMVKHAIWAMLPSEA